MKKVPVVAWPVIGGFLLLIIVGVFLFKIPRLGKIPSKTSDLIPGESLKISDINYSQDYSNGEGKWNLKAKEGHFYDNNQILELTDVFLKLDTGNKNFYTIKGNKGHYWRESGKIVLKGNVLGRSATGYQIETSLLTFRQKDNEVETDDPIQIIGPFFRIKGTGLYIDLIKNKFTVKKDVCTTIIGEEFFQ
ncbi:MAG: LPS export ABC transporter periplasmic protein LptC [Thermodesulfobacteriota bacterium]